MRKRKLVVYPNCSKGGVCAVLRARARSEPDVQYDLVFLRDKGGIHAYDDLDNVSIRIVRRDRIAGYLSYIAKALRYTEVSVLSDPSSANLLAGFSHLIVTYEFHSSNIAIIESELSKLDVDKIARIAAPSPHMADIIRGILPPRNALRVEVRPNLVDGTLFRSEGDCRYFSNCRFEVDRNIKRIPLLWVGRFDKGKGYHYFLRALSKLPEQYFGVVVVSLESEVPRINAFYSECYALGVQGRVRLFLDLPQSEMADLYRATGAAGGMVVSTSLMESFGYAVAEALSSGVGVVAYDLPVWDNFRSDDQLKTVESGDVQGLVDAIIE